MAQMVKITTFGIDDFIAQLQRIENDTDPIMREVMKDGINEVADVMKAQLRGLKTVDDKTWKKTLKKGKRYATRGEKEGLIESMGYTHTDLRESVYNAKVGFDGYNKTKTKKYPKGQPNPMIANFIDRGTSYMIPQPFISRTKSQSKAKALEKMQKRLDGEIQQRTK